jgi:methionine-S-sulfoxide reductase
VESTTVGYAGGTTKNPTYGDVCSGKTGHAEVVEVKYDPAVISFHDLLKTWLSIHDPTMDARHHRGGQYRSLVYFTNKEQEEEAKRIFALAQEKLGHPLSSELVAAPTFYRAEEYHQKYYEKNNAKICR